MATMATTEKERRIVHLLVTDGGEVTPPAENVTEYVTLSIKPNHAEPSLHCPVEHDTEPNWWYDCDRNDIV